MEKNVRKIPIFTNLKKRFAYIELPAKLLVYFSRSNKSNINRFTKHFIKLGFYGHAPISQLQSMMIICHLFVDKSMNVRERGSTGGRKRERERGITRNMIQKEILKEKDSEREML